MIKIQMTLLDIDPGPYPDLRSLESKLVYMVDLIRTIAPEVEVELKLPASTLPAPDLPEALDPTSDFMNGS